MSLSSKKCCVPGCLDSGRTLKPLHLFPNPVNEIKRFNTWVYSIGGDIIASTNDAIYKHRRVCHAHFEEKYHCRYNKLSKIAVPTLNLPGVLQQFQKTPSLLPSCSKDPEIIVPETEMITPETLKVATKSTLDNIGATTSINPEIIIPETEIITPETLKDVTNPTQDNMGAKKSSIRQKSKLKNMTMRVTKNTLTTVEHQLYRKVIKMRCQIAKYRSKIKRQSASLKAANKLTANPAFVAAIDRLPNSAKLLTMTQFREMKKKDKGRRFLLNEKIMALSIFKQSPKCYRFLRKIFILPAPQTLAKLINNANLKPGVNKKIFHQIKKATTNSKVEDRLCVLLFDEMALKANITYNERKDQVIGFVTDGQTMKPEYADHAQVFMVRGLMRNFKQPVSYTFSAGATCGSELAKQVKGVITELQEAGLIVMATVCDQGTNNRRAIKLLVQETRGQFLRSGKELRDNIFTVNDHEIIPLYDPPHLIKCIRNNLLTKNLTYMSNDKKQKTAKWQHIDLLHQENPGYKGIRLIPKLTENHVIPSKISKMKVKYATQIFSRTVASNMGYLADKGILPKECHETADILLFFDELFDSLNGSYMKKGRYAKPLLGPARPNSVHATVWQNAKKMLKNMTFTNVTTGKAEKVPTIENWVWTLDGVQNLLKKLNANYSITSVWMRHLNQDPIENFFGAIRSHGCRNTNPTPERFESAYASLLINNISSVHAPGANCEKDFCKSLSTLILTDDCQVTATSHLDTIPDVHITDVSEKNDPRVMGPLQFVSGYFVKKAQKQVFRNCVQCTKDMITPEENEYIRRREYAGRHWLISPSESLLTCASAVQDIAHNVLSKNVQCYNLKEFLKTLILLFISFDFMKCENHKEKLIEYLLNLSCRFYIYNYCKDVNNILKGRRDCSDEEDIFKLKAKKLYHKCFKRKNK